MFRSSIESVSFKSSKNKIGFQPSLERLEERITPSGEQVTLTFTYQIGQYVAVAGHASDNGGSLANTQINFTGASIGNTTTDSYGNYWTMLKVSNLGNLNAQTADGLSNIATVNLIGGSPVIRNAQRTANTFTVAYLGNNQWQFSGFVTGAPNQGEQVHLEGLACFGTDGKYVTVDPNTGAWSDTETILPGQGGDVLATAIDWWGDESTQVSGTVPV